jgi:hypothetical protein
MMFRRHVDFVAVLCIAVALLAFSKLSWLRMPDLGDSVRLQKAMVNNDSCPMTRSILALFN